MTTESATKTLRETMDAARDRSQVQRQTAALESIATSLEKLASVIDTRTAMPHVRSMDYSRPL